MRCAFELFAINESCCSAERPAESEQLHRVTEFNCDISSPSSGLLCAVRLKRNPNTYTKFTSSGFAPFPNKGFIFCFYAFQGAERKIRDEERKLFRKKSKGRSREKKDL